MAAIGPQRRAATGTRADWQTPRALFDWLDEIYGFDLDAAASAENSLCPWHIDASRNALLTTRSWCEYVPGGFDRVVNIWVNPPYGDLLPWVRRFIRESERSTIVALLPANTDTAWFAECWKTASGIAFLTPRIQFVYPNPPEAGLRNPDRNTGGSMLVIWDHGVLENGVPVVSLVNWRKAVAGQ